MHKNGYGILAVGCKNVGDCSEKEIALRRRNYPRCGEIDEEEDAVVIRAANLLSQRKCSGKNEEHFCCVSMHTSHNKLILGYLVQAKSLPVSLHNM